MTKEQFETPELSPTQPLDISALGVLAESVRQQEATASSLFMQATGLLEQAGRETTINSLAAIATPQYMEVTLDDTPLYARLARLIPRAGTEIDNPSIIFCTSTDFNDITTSNGYFSALTFRGALFSEHLVAGGGVNTPVSDQPEHLELAKAIIGTLSSKYGGDRKAAQLAEERAEKKRQDAEAKQKIQSARKIELETIRKKNVHEQRVVAGKKNASKLGIVTLSVSTLWYTSIHAVFSHDEVNAKIGLFPLPAPIEWVVDWNNHSDHVAQGFKKPVGALALSVGMKPTDIPLLTTYNASDTPDMSYVPFDTSQEEKEDSKPGLYNSDFDFQSNYDSQSSHPRTVVFDANGCYSVHGSFQDGKTVVFTQTSNLNNLVDITVPSTTVAEICKKPNAPQDASGSVYFYQNQ